MCRAGGCGRCAVLHPAGFTSVLFQHLWQHQTKTQPDDAALGPEDWRSQTVPEMRFSRRVKMRSELWLGFSKDFHIIPFMMEKYSIHTYCRIHMESDRRGDSRWKNRKQNGKKKKQAVQRNCRMAKQHALNHMLHLSKIYKMNYCVLFSAFEPLISMNAVTRFYFP